ncbi:MULTISPECIES: hypothetical protein [Streptomyces]|uniref:Uncharacterized protein n=1 Tax=Streptomyces achmelvichensis TaxID=3134111 RepID=A0ACC6PUX4_9ACTN|nr:hypothetical protein OG317_14530 [Streptomyces sp. NBC_01167]
MSVSRMSVRGKVVALAGVLAIAAAGLGVWLWAGDKGDAKPLSAPANPCWDGMPSQGSMQKLLGPGNKFFISKSPYRVIKDHWPSHCAYDVESDDRVELVLSMHLSWDNEPPKADDFEAAGALRGDKAKTFDAGVHAYYLGPTNRLYFQCDVDQPKDAPEYIRNDKYVEVNVLAHPMDSAHLTAKQAREVGLDMVLEVAHKVADQAGCTNDTNLPKTAPQVADANWPRFH